MEKIKIITDSTLDLPADLIKEKGIEVLPLLINFGEESYLDGVEINIHQMLERIEKDNILPTTAQVTPNRFEEVFKKYLDEGYKIVALLLSSEMSGTYQSACIAKNMLESVTNEFITKAQELVPNGNVKILERVELPKNPVAPNKKMNIAIAFILGMMVGFGIVFLLEYLDNTYKNKEQLEKDLDIPVLGVIPMSDLD